MKYLLFVGRRELSSYFHMYHHNVSAACAIATILPRREERDEHMAIKNQNTKVL